MAPGTIEDLYPLSPVQQGMLFYVLSAPRSGVYFEQFVLSYEQGLDPDTFVAAWQQVLDRHPILRTSFLWENLEAPVQVVHRNVRLPVERLDWRGRPPAEQESDLRAYAAADRRRGFDLARPPLLRLALIRVGEEAYRVVWGHHHLLLDGWSVGLMMREILEAYRAQSRAQSRAAVSGEPAPPVPRRPFKDFLGWQRQLGRAAEEPYWRRALAGFQEPTPLPLDRTGEPAIHPDYELRVLRLPPEQNARLRAFAQGQRVTLTTVIYAAWALLLGRAAGTRDVVFGTTVSGRSPALQGVEAMMGCLINTLPVRVREEPEAGLADWLRRLQRGLVEMRRHEQTPLADVLGWAEVPRRQPLFESLVIFESFTPDAAFVMTHNGVFQRSHYALTLVASPEPELALRLGYEPARFEEGAVLRMLGQLQALLAAFMDDPARPVGELALRDPLAARQMIVQAAPRRPRPAAAPRTEHEEAVAAIWRRVLGVAEIGIDDDFFDLGGHSLLLLKAAVRIRRELGRELPLEGLLACRSVAALCAWRLGEAGAPLALPEALQRTAVDAPADA